MQPVTWEGQRALGAIDENAMVPGIARQAQDCSDFRLLGPVPQAHATREVDWVRLLPVSSSPDRQYRCGPTTGE